MRFLMPCLTVSFLVIVAQPGSAQDKPAAKPGPAKKQPERPPELFGIVERIEKRTILPDCKEFEAILIKGHPPLNGKLKPSSPLYSNGEPDLMWLNMPHTTVERRNGPIVVGQYVWVWYDGKIFKTDPGQIYPEYVISEAVMKK
jgi:hypothetical protein